MKVLQRAITGPFFENQHFIWKKIVVCCNNLNKKHVSRYISTKMMQMIFLWKKKKRGVQKTDVVEAMISFIFSRIYRNFRSILQSIMRGICCPLWQFSKNQFFYSLNIVPTATSKYQYFNIKIIGLFNIRIA